MYIFFLKGRNLKCCEYCGVCVCACVCVCECMCAVSSVGLHPSACRKCFRLHFTIFFTVSCLAPCFNTVVPAGSHGSIDEQRAHVSMQL